MKLNRLLLGTLLMVFGLVAGSLAQNTDFKGLYFGG